MPYVKTTVHLGRIASTALKSFTHGYAQTVVAATQSGYGVQNANAGPLTDTLVGRFRQSAERSKLAGPHNADTRQASAAVVSSSARPDTAHPDAGLEKYLDAWQKYQRAGAKEWQQFQFAKRIEWQPPSTVPVQVQSGAAAEAEEVKEEKNQDLAAPHLKRSYTTSALDNFGKVFIDEETLEQVNNAIAEEIQRCKDEASEDQEVLALKTSPTVPSEEASSATAWPTKSTPLSSLTPSPISSTLPEADFFTQQLTDLSASKRHADIPLVFESMLRAGVKQPAPAAYRALLISATELTSGKHAKASKALELYSDMLKRRVTPDSETFGLLIALLASRSSECLATLKSLETRRTRYGGFEQPGKFMFSSNESEHAMCAEDSSLSIALKLFSQASSAGVPLPAEACLPLIVACAEQSRLEDMIQIHAYMQEKGMEPESRVYPAMIRAFGALGDLRNAVEYYDEYKELAIANNAGMNDIDRIDYQIYAALIMAYGSADRLKGGLKFLSSIQAEITDPKQLESLRETVALDALLPLALKDPSLHNAMDLTQSLSGSALNETLTRICEQAADANMLDVSVQVYDMLSQRTKDLTRPAIAMVAMHVRNANVEAAEPYFRVLESAPSERSFIEPTTMRAIAMLSRGQLGRALTPTRRIFARMRDAQPESALAETAQQIDEAISLISTTLLRNGQMTALQPAAGIEALRMMLENDGLVAPLADHIVAQLGPEQIVQLNNSDIELLLQVQSGMIQEASSADIAGPARFGCLLENMVSRSIMLSPETQTLIERALVNIDRPELSRLWNTYRYPPTPATLALSPYSAFQSPTAPYVVQPAFDDAFDPYAAKTDVKGSNAINELLERPSHGRSRLNEALGKFRNMRRIGRVPRMFTYGKLIETAAKENNLTVATDVLEMARQDVKYDHRYRVVRFGWHQILDHMVAACLTVGRRDLASRFHQELLDMGATPSANTFGLYITTLKENTKTFDEASEAVKIFLRAKAEGVEPTSFLYNALIGKLGKARRIDDCLFYFAEMRNLGIRPTSVTYGTIVNALCRVSDEKFAEEIFEEMEACSNYKPRPAPYHSLMQFFLTTKRDRSKILAYYERMRSKGIEPTVHTYKLLIDAHATIEPVNMTAAGAVLEDMRASGVEPEAVHYASLIHAKGCVLHDMAAARDLFDSVVRETRIKLQPCLYQALFESMNANHNISDSVPLLQDMAARGVEFTPYIANALIHGWTLAKDISKAKAAFERLSMGRREPSTYEAMVRAYLASEQREAARGVVREALSRGYPSAVAGKIAELVR